jgi:hypothetical protein
VIVWLLVLALGCNVLGDEDPDKNCDPRIPFWPDADGDGVGDAGSAMYLGCEAPDGYVDVPPGTEAGQDSDLDSDAHTDEG